MKIATEERPLLYHKIAGDLEKQINEDVLKIGDRLPSIRSLCREQGISPSTALQAYYHLEAKGLIESRPQSGYYVRYSPKRFPEIPSSSRPEKSTAPKEAAEIISRVYRKLNSKDTTLLSLGAPAEELLPIARLNKAMVKAMRDLPGSGTYYEDIEGSEKLRRQVARWAFNWGGRLTENDIITTAGCMGALSHCLMALTSRGDTIAVESPVYFGVLQLAQSLGLKVLELPTNPVTGVEPEALKKVLKTGKIFVCLLVSNFNNPLGSSMPEEHKKETVRLLERYNVPLIEDDIYGDIFFGDSRPRNCKTYDESGLVLWCSSVSKTLAPGYRVGWVAPGRFAEKVRRMKLYHTVTSPTLPQEVIASFLESGRYENHLRKLRHQLHANSLQYIRAITEYFPEGTKVSHPKGGFVLWVELDKAIDTVELYEQAARQHISISPGRMFTLQKQFDNCMRLSYGLPWSSALDRTLYTLGELVKKNL